MYKSNPYKCSKSGPNPRGTWWYRHILERGVCSYQPAHRWSSAQREGFIVRLLATRILDRDKATGSLENGYSHIILCKSSKCAPWFFREFPRPPAFGLLDSGSHVLAGDAKISSYIEDYVQKTSYYGYFYPKDLQKHKASYPKTLEDAEALYGPSIPCHSCGALEGGTLNKTGTRESPNHGRYALVMNEGLTLRIALLAECEFTHVRILLWSHS